MCVPNVNAIISLYSNVNFDEESKSSDFVGAFDSIEENNGKITDFYIVVSFNLIQSSAESENARLNVLNTFGKLSYKLRLTTTANNLPLFMELTNRCLDFAEDGEERNDLITRNIVDVYNKRFVLHVQNIVLPDEYDQDNCSIDLLVKREIEGIDDGWNVQAIMPMQIIKSTKTWQTDEETIID